MMTINNYKIIMTIIIYLVVLYIVTTLHYTVNIGLEYIYQRGSMENVLKQQEVLGDVHMH